MVTTTSKTTSRILNCVHFGTWVLFAAFVFTAWPVQLGGHTGYTIVSGTSMVPTFHTGDLLITRYKQNYQKGQVVVYKVPKGTLGAGHLVVHRLVAGSGAPTSQGWTTKGDNNPSRDIWTPHNTDVVGIVVLNIGKAGFILRQIRDPLLYASLGALFIGYLLWPRSKTKSATAQISVLQSFVQDGIYTPVPEIDQPDPELQRFVCTINHTTQNCSLALGNQPQHATLPDPQRFSCSIKHVDGPCTLN